MPWPMVHFAITMNITLNDPSPSFLIGSISPDSIHARKNITRKDKGYTHLVKDDVLPSAKDISKECLKYLNKCGDDNWKDFVKGYFSHIYTDLRWTETIYSEFDRNYRGEKQSQRNTYNIEVSQIEFNLLASEEWSQDAISRVQRAKGISIEPFVSSGEVERYRDEKIKWLQNPRNEPNIHPCYFEEDKVRDFILMTANELIVILKDWDVGSLEEGRNIS